MEQYPDVVQVLIRRRAGIYVLYKRDKLYYVGLAKNLMGRLKGHLRDRHRGSWDRFSVYLTVLDEHMKELESLVLRITKPAGNKAGGKFVASRNLRQDLYRAMREADADRIGRLLGGKVAQQRRRAKTRGLLGSMPLAGVVDRSIVLIANYKGKKHRATLRRDGRIRVKGVLYDGPKQAASAIVGRNISGWNFWKYKDGGAWVPLSTMRD